MNVSVASNEIGSVKKKTSKLTKVQDQIFTGKFYLTYKEEIMPVLL